MRRAGRGKGNNQFVTTDPLVLLDEVDRATARLLATAEGLDGDPATPSLLPGWTRGHVLTHIFNGHVMSVGLFRASILEAATRTGAGPSD